MSLRDLIHGLFLAGRDPRVRGLFVLTLTLIAIASVFYQWAEGWNLLDSVYFSVMTLATVGYGDFHPRSVSGKIFTIFYVVVGLGLFVALASSLADNIINDRRSRRQHEREKHDHMS